MGNAYHILNLTGWRYQIIQLCALLLTQIHTKKKIQITFTYIGTMIGFPFNFLILLSISHSFYN